MIDSAERERRGFSIWLRTRRRVRVRDAGAAETKYNHWHDVTNGQFTSAGGGRHDGGARGSSGEMSPGRRGYRLAATRQKTSDGSWSGGGFTGGGGGSSGGAGAGGDWGLVPKAAKPSIRQQRAVPVVVRLPLSHSPAQPPAKNVTAPVAKPALRSVVRNGYEFQIDQSGRTRRASGTLALAQSSTRSRKEQLRAGGSERRRTDEGGHYIAIRFNGPAEAFNHFAQDANFNRGGYAALERAWAADLKRGKRVVVKITPLYDGASKRPANIVVEFNKNGHTERQRFPNERQEVRHGK